MTLSSSYSSIKQIKSKIDSLAGVKSVKSNLKVSEVAYYNTSKAWEALKNGDINGEPDLLVFSSEDVEQYCQVPESGRSTPKHNISYFAEMKVCQFRNNYLTHFYCFFIFLKDRKRDCMRAL